MASDLNDIRANEKEMRSAATDADDVDESSRVPERLEYYSSTILIFVVVALIGFSVGAVGMMLILG
jgi:hypothetical protein